MSKNDLIFDLCPLQKKENLYPRLNDIDDDWNDTKESVEKKKEEKKVIFAF